MRTEINKDILDIDVDKRVFTVSPILYGLEFGAEDISQATEQDKKIIDVAFRSGAGVFKEDTIKEVIGVNRAVKELVRAYDIAKERKKGVEVLNYIKSLHGKAVVLQVFVSTSCGVPFRSAGENTYNFVLGQIGKHRSMLKLREKSAKLSKQDSDTLNEIDSFIINIDELQKEKQSVIEKWKREGRGAIHG